MDLFDHLSNLTIKKIVPDFSLEEVNKSYDIYMINRFVSMIEAWIPIVELVNEISLSKETHYTFLMNMLPKANVKFKYLSKKKNDKVFEEQKEILMKYFDFGTRDLECALYILTEEQIKNICKKYSYGKTK